MNALLVLPRYPESLWTYKYISRWLGKKASSPPLGLLIVAALLPSEWHKTFVNLNIHPLCEKDLADADIIFLSAMLSQQASALEIIAQSKQAGKRIVAGGPLFCPELISQGLFKDVDHIVIGEAETALPELLADLEKDYVRPCYRSKDFPEIEQVPIPDWLLVDLNDYTTVNLQFVRGCPYHCEFCYGNVLNGNIPRAKTPAQIEAELEALYQAGWRGMVFICDDNLIGNRRLARDRVLPAIISWMRRRNYPFTLTGAASVDLANEPDLMKMIVQAGFESLTLGIESPCELSLQEMNKVQNQHVDLIEAVHTIQSEGIEVQAGMILGLDHDPPSIFQEHINFLQQSGICNAMVSLLFAFPDTPLYTRLRIEHRLVKYDIGERVHGAIDFIPRMPLEQLQYGYKRVLANLYSPSGYYDRLEAFLNHYRPAPRRMHLQFTQLLPILSAIFRIGFVDSYRGRFWKLFSRAWGSGIDVLVAFIRQAILGYYMRDEIEEFTGNFDLWKGN